MLIGLASLFLYFIGESTNFRRTHIRRIPPHNIDEIRNSRGDDYRGFERFAKVERLLPASTKMAKELLLDHSDGIIAETFSKLSEIVISMNMFFCCIVFRVALGAPNGSLMVFSW